MSTMMMKLYYGACPLARLPAEPDIDLDDSVSFLEFFALWRLRMVF